MLLSNIVFIQEILTNFWSLLKKPSPGAFLLLPRQFYNNPRASRARWFRAFAGPRRERKGFLVAFNIRSRSYSTRRSCTINSSACCRSHERSKHQVGALLNGCQHPFGSEDDKRLEHIDCQQSGGGFAAFSGGKWQVWNQKSEKSPTTWESGEAASRLLRVDVLQPLVILASERMLTAVE